MCFLHYTISSPFFLLILHLLPPWLAAENDLNPVFPKAHSLIPQHVTSISPKLRVCGTFETHLMTFSHLCNGDSDSICLPACCLALRRPATGWKRSVEAESGWSLEGCDKKSRHLTELQREELPAGSSCCSGRLPESAEGSEGGRKEGSPPWAWAWEEGSTGKCPLGGSTIQGIRFAASAC